MRELRKKSKPNLSQGQHIQKADEGKKDFFGVQAKLEMGQPGDQYEQEADAVADQVVNQSRTGEGVQQQETQEEEIQQKPIGSTISRVQKQDLKEEQPLQKQPEESPEEESLQMATEEEEQEAIQAKDEEEPIQTQMAPQGTKKSEASPDIEKQLNQSKGSGKSMDDHTRHEMESGFGVDFSQVRIHDDPQAAQMSQGIGAQAFTHGHDIYFNKGKYNPENQSGKHLLAHELTHIIQQKGMRQKKIQGHWSKSETYRSFEGGVIKADLHLNFTAAVLNKSTNSGLNSAGLASAAKSQIENSYKGKLTKKLMGIEVVYDVKTTANIRVIPKLTDLNLSKDHLIVVLDDAHPKVNGTYGRGPFYGTIVYLNEKYTPGMISGSDKNTIPHEVGHTAGLKHLLEKREESNLLGKLIRELHHQHNKDNIMWRGGGHPSYSMADADSKLVKTNPEQLKEINKNLNAGKLNQTNLFTLTDLFLLSQ